MAIRYANYVITDEERFVCLNYWGPLMGHWTTCHAPATHLGYAGNTQLPLCDRCADRYRQLDEWRIEQVKKVDNAD